MYSKNLLHSSIVVMMLILALAALAAACNSRPEGVPDTETMAQLVADLHRAESLAEANSRSFPDDSARRVLKQSVYMKYGLTPEMADSAFRWYGYNIEKYVEVYDRSIEILEEEMAHIEQLTGGSSSSQADAALSLEGDSVDVWTGTRLRRFSPLMPNELITFNFTSDPNWEHGDMYRFKAKMLPAQQPAVLSVAIEYQDGSKEYLSKRLIGDGWHEVRWAVDSTKTARDISGTIYYPTSGSEIAYIDSITLTRTRWSAVYTTIREDLKSLQPKSARRWRPAQ